MTRIPTYLLVTATIILATAHASPTMAQDPEQLFQKGLIKEEGEGMPEEAIAIFNTVVNDVSADRSLRANALLHVGYCYEKLGQQKAIESYERLIADFADQEDVVVIGKQKLSVMKDAMPAQKTAGIVVKEIWSNAEDTYGISPDGRYMNYIDWKAIELAVKDLHSGESWYLTNTGTWKPPMQFPDISIWSPDGNKLAYYWFNGDSSELHIINRDGTDDHMIYKDAGNDTPWPVHWSGSGDFILAFKSSGDETDAEAMVTEVVLISPDDGSLHVMQTFKGLQSGCCGSISPDSRFVAYANQQSSGGNQNDIYIQAVDGSYFDCVVEDPANDKNPVWTPDGNALLFMSDRNGSYDLWKLKVNNGVPEGMPELVYSNMGRTRLLGFAGDQSLYYSSSHLRADIYMASLDFQSGEMLTDPAKISQADIKMNIKPFLSPDGRYIAYIDYPIQRDNILGERFKIIIHDTETGTSKNLDTDLHAGVRNYWNQPAWSPDGTKILVHGRTADKLQGFFVVDVKTGQHTPIYVKPLEPMSTQTFLGLFPRFSRDGKNIYFISADRKVFIRRNIETGQEQTIFENEEEILHYAISRDESKIAFGHFFEDRNALFTVSTKGGGKNKIAGFEKGVTPYVLDWSTDDRDIIFTKGAYSDEKSPEIWRIPANGGEARMVIDLNGISKQGGVVREIDINPVNRSVVASFLSGSWLDIWAMENICNKE